MSSTIAAVLLLTALAAVTFVVCLRPALRALRAATRFNPSLPPRARWAAAAAFVAAGVLCAIGDYALGHDPLQVLFVYFAVLGVVVGAIALDAYVE